MWTVLLTLSIILDSELNHNHGSPRACNIRLLDFFRRNVPSSAAILDVGGGEGQMSKLSRNYTCIDVFHTRACTRFDGKSLSHAAKSFDVVMFNWVLHHANDNTIQLLRDAQRIARRFVLINEDLKGVTHEEILRQFHHERQGTYRGVTEWEAIFRLLHFHVNETHNVSDTCAGKYIVPRRFWALVPTKTGL